jgi:hypothetical protein
MPLTRSSYKDDDGDEEFILPPPESSSEEEEENEEDCEDDEYDHPAPSYAAPAQGTSDAVKSLLFLVTKMLYFQKFLMHHVQLCMKLVCLVHSIQVKITQKQVQQLCLYLVHLHH